MYSRTRFLTKRQLTFNRMTPLVPTFHIQSWCSSRYVLVSCFFWWWNMHNRACSWWVCELCWFSLNWCLWLRPSQRQSCTCCDLRDYFSGGSQSTSYGFSKILRFLQVPIGFSCIFPLYMKNLDMSQHFIVRDCGIDTDFGSFHNAADGLRY